VQAWNTFHLNGDTRLFRRGIGQIAGQTTPDGVTYGHAPTMAHECILPDFTLIWMLTLWDYYYWQTGSTEVFAAHHDVLQKALAYFRGQTDPRTGLVTNDNRYWLFLDWTDLFKDGSPAVYNLWLLIALERMAALYRLGRRPREAVPLETWAQRLRLALNRLINKDGLLRDGFDRRGKAVSGTSIHAQTLGLLARLKGIDEQVAFDRILLPHLRGEISPKAIPSAYWITYLFSLFIERGRGAEIIPYIKQYWLPMAEHGTTWENFTPRRGEGSFSHAWSAHPLYHLMQTVGGIVQTAPTWRRISFRPVFHGDHGRTVIPTPNGPVISSWRRAKESIRVSLQMPKDTKARVVLPGIKVHSISKSQEWTVPSSTIEAVHSSP
jgi:hypothetical protein